MFFNPAARPGARLGPEAVDSLLAEMARRDIRTHLGHKMVRFEEKKVVTEGGEFAADLILFMPGLTGPAWLDKAGLPLSPGGMVAADVLCPVKDRPNVWVIGDAGSYPGPDWLAKQAHQADLQAKAFPATRSIQERPDHDHRRLTAGSVCTVPTLSWQTPPTRVRTARSRASRPWRAYLVWPEARQ